MDKMAVVEEQLPMENQLVQSPEPAEKEEQRDEGGRGDSAVAHVTPRRCNPSKIPFGPSSGTRFSLYVSPCGTISVIFRNHVFVEMTVDKTIRVLCQGKISPATSSRGTHGVLIKQHRNGDLAVHNRPRSIRASPSSNTVFVRTHFVDMGVPEDDKAFVSRGVKRKQHSGRSGMTVSDGNCITAMVHIGRIFGLATMIQTCEGATLQQRKGTDNAMSGLISAIVFLVLIGIILCACCKRKPPKHSNLGQPEAVPPPAVPPPAVPPPAVPPPAVPPANIGANRTARTDGAEKQKKSTEKQKKNSVQAKKSPMQEKKSPMQEKKSPMQEKKSYINQHSGFSLPPDQHVPSSYPSRK